MLTPEEIKELKSMKNVTNNYLAWLASEIDHGRNPQGLTFEYFCNMVWNDIEVTATKVKEGSTNVDDTVNTDGVFVDSHGNVVKDGSRIVIEHHYKYGYLNNREARVRWNGRMGRYEWVIDSGTGKEWMSDSFVGVHSFRVIG